MAARLRIAAAAVALVGVGFAASPADAATRTTRPNSACSAKQVGATTAARGGGQVRCTKIGRRTYRWRLVVVAPPATTVPAPAPPSAPVPAPAGWQEQMLAKVNAERAAAGVAPLSWCPTLSVAAQRHTDDMLATSTLTHTGSDGSGLKERAERAGYLGWNRLGENVAYGYPDVDAVMAGWMGSSGHKANLLNPAFTHLGAAQATGVSTMSGGTFTLTWWTQDFGANGTC
jgi:uncharacterized protein YkwD